MYRYVLVYVSEVGSSNVVHNQSFLTTKLISRTEQEEPGTPSLKYKAEQTEQAAKKEQSKELQSRASGAHHPHFISFFFAKYFHFPSPRTRRTWRRARPCPTSAASRPPPRSSLCPAAETGELLVGHQRHLADLLAVAQPVRHPAGGDAHEADGVAAEEPLPLQLPLQKQQVPGVSITNPSFCSSPPSAVDQKDIQNGRANCRTMFSK